MPKQGKKFQAASKQVESRPYNLSEAVPLVQKIKFAKFDETVELHLRLASIPSTPIRWFAGLSSFRTVWGNPKKSW
jgi:large subunit ribosomal protein L1